MKDGRSGCNYLDYWRAYIKLRSLVHTSSTYSKRSTEEKGPTYLMFFKPVLHKEKKERFPSRFFKNLVRSIASEFLGNKPRYLSPGSRYLIKRRVNLFVGELSIMILEVKQGKKKEARRIRLPRRPGRQERWLGGEKEHEPSNRVTLVVTTFFIIIIII